MKIRNLILGIILFCVLTGATLAVASFWAGSIPATSAAIIAALGYTPVPTTTTVNGHALSGNVMVTLSDVGGLPSTSPQITGATAITSGFVGTMSSSSTTLTFTSAADAVLAGYPSSLGFTVTNSATSVHILAWLSSVTCTIDASPAWAASTSITSVQAPISVFVNSSGVLEMAEWVNGNIYFAGSVGIGTTSPNFSLQVNGSIAVPRGTGFIGFTDGSTNIRARMQSDSSNDLDLFVGSGANPVLVLSGGGGGVGIGTTPGITNAITLAGANFVVNSNGNVGIGTTNPSYALSVQDSTVLGTESCAYPTTFSNAVWTLAGDFAVNGSAATFTKSSGSGTITQTAANQAQVSAGNRWYQIQYIVPTTPTVVGATMTLTTGFAFSSTTLPIVAGTNTILFRSAAAPANIVLSVSGATSGAFTLTSVSIKEVQGGSIALGADIKLGPTLMPAGTTGNVTINKSSGQVRIAAAGTTVTITDSLVTANSIIMAMVASNDTTAQVKNVVPTGGSFTINMVAGVTNETPISFVIFN